MDHKIQATQHWPLGWRVALTTAAVIVVYLVQLPLEHQVPGEPFLLFSLVVIATTLAFGRSNTCGATATEFAPRRNSRRSMSSTQSSKR